jgi:glycosyltransferase involved in cell wall biosynthesis
MGQSLSIVIPAYNEAEVIGSVIDELPKNIKVNNKDLKVNVIVINDGSKDKTAEIVSQRKHVHLINHLLNSGAGAATRTGFNVAKRLNSNYVITMDADGQHHHEDVAKLAQEITKGEADYIIGSRLIETEGMPWYRVLGNKGLSFITFLVFGVFVGDSQSGLRAYNRKALDKITFHSNHYAFCSEMIWSAHRENLRIKEIPIKAIYTDYSLGKGQSNWGAIAIIRQILKRRILTIFNG